MLEKVCYNGKAKILFLLVVLFLSTTVFSQKYIFLFIGDGMGQPCVDLYEAYLAAENSDTGFVSSNISRLPLLSFATTNCKNSLITDSGAAGSAIACGQKFNFGEISFSDSEKQPQSIAKFAKSQGLKIGIISTVSLNHATPAAFYANCKSRKNYYDIGLQLANSNFDFFGGGGFYHQTGRKKDSKDLYTIFQEAGYLTFSSLKAISTTADKSQKVIFTNETLERDASMPYEKDRTDGPSNSLAEILQTAIEHLDNEKGFFIMVEGGKIDEALHDNDAGALLGEMEDFDNAVATAYNFYLKHKGETAIIVTADHETGGLALGTTANQYNSNPGILVKQKMSMLKFSNILKKLSKNDKEFTIKEYQKMAFTYFMGVDTDFSSAENDILTQAYLAVSAKTPRAIEEAKETYEGYNPIAYAFSKIMNERAGVGFSTNAHTFARVPVYALGISTPIKDNTEFFNAIKNFIEK